MTYDELLQARLKEFSTEELKEEIKRRAKIKRQAADAIPRCRNCEYCEKREVGCFDLYYCLKRTYKYKKLSTERNYVVTPSKMGCLLYKRKTE